MKMNLNREIILYISIFMTTVAFYLNRFDKTKAVVVRPKTNAELTYALCSKFAKGRLCVDSYPKVIILDRVFSFIKTEGTTTEKGCWHMSNNECYLRGQKKLNINNQCAGLESVDVTYDNAGRNPLIVGSNKYVMGEGKAGIKGKGIHMCSVHDVIINNLFITDINAQLIWGGDAISMDNVTNVLINGNYIQNIGRQMIVTGFGACQGIMISNNEFNGITPFSAYCDKHHYWMFLFLGKNDTIAMYNNKIHNAAGRLPHVTGMQKSAVLLHIIENYFYDISYTGGVEALDYTARILVEGNKFVNVSRIVCKNYGALYFPLTPAQCNACIAYIGRPCEANVIVNSGINNIDTDIRVLTDLKPYASILTKPRNHKPTIRKAKVNNKIKANKKVKAKSKVKANDKAKANNKVKDNTSKNQSAKQSTKQKSTKH